MKRTELERKERDLKRSKKKVDVQQRRSEKGSQLTPGEYINNLFSLFFFDETKIYNINDSEQSLPILEVLEDIKNNLPESQWDNIIRKAVRKTKVKQKEEAVNQLKELLSSN